MTHIVITGGAGYLGRRLAHRALAESDMDVLLHVRADDAPQLAARSQELDAEFGPLAHRVGYIGGDLAGPEPLAAVDPADAGIIVHAAAITRFNVDERSAQRANVQATANVLEFADRCPSLESLALLSTIYSSGLRPGTIFEEGHDDEHGFSNFYESSKWQAERMLLDQYSHLPFRILRVATVIAEDDGSVSQYNAFHNTLKLYYYGLLSLLPGAPSTPLYFVTGGFVVDAVWHLLWPEVASGIYHVAHEGHESATLDDLIAIAFESFESHDEFRRRRILRPLYVDRQSFDVFSHGIGGFASAR